MTLPLFSNTPNVIIHNGKAITTSLDVADYFCKLHKDVLKKIKALECSTEFTERNFSLCYKNNELQNGKPQKYYEMTKDGFVFLVMGFTGKKAAQFKEAYIAEFNRMESELYSMPKRRPEAPELLTDNDTRNLAHLVWSMANGFRFEKAWTQGIWYALRHATGVASPQHFEVNQISIIAEECRRIYGMTSTLKSAIFDAEKQVIRRLLRHQEDVETVLREMQQLLEVSTHEHDSVMIQSLKRWQQTNVNRFLQRC